jgi:hypothetical protein
MKWPLSSIGALLARLRGGRHGDRTGARRGPAHPPVTSSAAMSGPVTSTSPGLMPDGRPQPDLRARAERQCNRNRKLVARYLATHRVLMNGRGA